MKFNLLKNKEKKENSNSVISEKTREKSTGRSMVEMLGVLAIIGVLSIGGIQGYTMAMRRYRANEIFNVASKYAAIVWTKINQRMLNEPDQYFWSRYPDFYATLPSDYLEKGHSEGYTLEHENRTIMDQNFSDSGLGGLPAGVQDMFVWSISASKSGILVNLSVSTNDQSLCETLKAQIDNTAEFYEWFCTNSNNEIYLSFPQN